MFCGVGVSFAVCLCGCVGLDVVFYLSIWSPLFHVLFLGTSFSGFYVFHNDRVICVAVVFVTFFFGFLFVGKLFQSLCFVFCIWLLLSLAFVFLLCHSCVLFLSCIVCVLKKKKLFVVLRLFLSYGVCVFFGVWHDFVLFGLFI